MEFEPDWQDLDQEIECFPEIILNLSSGFNHNNLVHLSPGMLRFPAAVAAESVVQN